MEKKPLTLGKDVQKPENRRGGAEQLKNSPLNKSSSHDGAIPHKEPFTEEFDEEEATYLDLPGDEPVTDGMPESFSSFGGYDWSKFKKSKS